MSERNNKLYKKFGLNRRYILYRGDCFSLLRRVPDNHIDLTITSPPYCMGKAYENTKNVNDFIKAHQRLLPEIIRITKEGGSICWQVGYHAKNSQVVPLDFLIYDILKEFKEIKLRNRIIWTFGHGLHAQKKFSGRHETILWFTKGKNYQFDLDAIRVPQKYPGKKHYKGSKKGQYSGNPLGKNPGDVWDIPNIKAHHVEKTEHPCQFPVALVQRLIKGLSSQEGVIFDPFMGSGTTGVASIIEGRDFIGAELDSAYHDIAFKRCNKAIRKELLFRPIEKPITTPNPSVKVSIMPNHFLYI